MEASTIVAPTSGPNVLENPHFAGDPWSEWARYQYRDKYSWKDENGEPTEEWMDTGLRVLSHNLGTLGYRANDPEFQRLLYFIHQRIFIPGGRYLANSGKPKHQVANCFLYRCADSIADDDGWADLVSKCIKSLSSGGGVGVVYSAVRGYGNLVKATGNMATGPLSPACMVNEVARHVKSGSRRSAIWGGLHWWHSDIFDWITAKDWSNAIRAAKEQDFSSPAQLDMTNISVILDTDFFTAYQDSSHPKHEHAHLVYQQSLAHMLRHGEPGFSVDIGENHNENLRNPCCEVSSEDDSDICNLGSINMSRITSLEEMKEVVHLATLFLISGTVYGDVPHTEVREVRHKNRRIGLGLMGVHEWLISHGYGYEVTPELREYLEIYRDESDAAAEYWASRHGLSIPIKRRAIAPNGTISIIGETTSGMEPMYAVAFRRRFLDEGKIWRHQYVIDPTAQRLTETHGIDPDEIESAYILALNPEKRIKFQADLQEYVDHAISSTINLPYPITDPDEVEDFGNTLMTYLPKLRGVTVYPEGSRAGQPLTPVTYYEAIDKVGVTFDEERGACVGGGVCGV
jgi:ribonucleoside-diphosphate reductase alpha chain